MIDKQQVTLTISSLGSIYISNIQIYTGFDNTFHTKITSEEYRNSSEIILGNLSELRNSYMRIDTMLIPESGDIARINYTIKYGLVEVESKEFASELSENKASHFTFNFRFCPRYPFC